MEWWVVKLGTDMFDALHAYGLGIWLAHATGASVELRDKGLVYQLICSGAVRSDGPAALLKGILALPTIDDIEATEQEHDACGVAVANIDGLLAAQFTTPGKRLVSVHDMLSKQSLNAAVMQGGLAKVRAAVERSIAYVERWAHPSSTWTTELLSDYVADRPSFPVPVNKQARDISIPMPIDPTFSSSTRRPLSDGWITKKTRSVNSA